MKQQFINKLNDLLDHYNDLLLTYQAQVLIDVATEDEIIIDDILINKLAPKLVEIGPMLHKVKELVEEA